MLFALVLSLLSTQSVLAADPQTDVFARAVPLDRALSGHLDAATGGRVAYYRFDYPANGSDVTIELQVSVPLEHAGIKVYGPRAGREYVAGGSRSGNRVVGSFSSSDPADRGTYTVQVYNYDPVRPIDYTITLAGLPPASAAAPAAPTEARPTPPPGPSSDENTYRGRLEAGSSGRFAMYEFDYPGDGSLYTIQVTILPDDLMVLRGAGFNIYGPRSASPYVVGAVQQGKRPNLIGDLSTRDPGTYVVQIYNYNPNTAVDYVITLFVNPRR